MSRRTLELVHDGPATAARAGGEAAPELSYLARDYASFRQLILDRLAQLIPDWQERHVPDMGITLVDLLAYLGDHLSYFQDAVATEAYLGTARQRVSARRHARLVDYPMHEGCNARTFVHVEVAREVAAVEVDAGEVYFVTAFPGAPDGPALIGEEELHDRALPGSYLVFEPVPLQPPARILASDLPPLERLAPGPQPAPEAADESMLTPRQQPSREDEQRSTLEGRLISVGGAPPPVAALIDGQVSPELPGTLQELAQPDADQRDSPTAPARTRRAERARAAAERELQRAADALLDVPELGELLGTAARSPDEPRGAPAPDADPAVATHLRGGALRRHNRQLLDRALLDHRSPDRRSRPAEPAPIRGRGRLTFYRAHNELDAAPVFDQDGRLVKLSLTARPPDQGQPEELSLREGDLLLLEHQGGATADRHHVIRLATVRLSASRPPGRQGEAATLVTWGPEDALPASWGIAPDRPITLVARGNVVLVDHGLTVRDERLAPEQLPGGAAARVRLAQAPLTFAQPLPERQLSARGLLAQEPREALPQLTLYSAVDPWQNLDTVINISRDPYRPCWRHEWTPQRDLLSSGPRDPHFVAELDDQGAAQLRFGDGERGIRPEHLGRDDAPYTATYRVGNGLAGNIRPGSLRYMVYTRSYPYGIRGISQPLAARGGAPAEPIEEVRLFAPDYFRARIERAITADDYAEIVMREFAGSVQRAVATVGWNGTRYAAFVAIDPWASVAEQDRPGLCREIRDRLVARYRRMGHAVVVREATYVPIDLKLVVDLAPGAQVGVVRPALIELLTGSRPPDGRPGFFHPDNLTFGEDIYRSRLEALAHRVPGVQAVTVARLQRLGRGPDGELERGVLLLGPREIARLAAAPQPGDGALELEFQQRSDDARGPAAAPARRAEPAPVTTP